MNIHDSLEKIARLQEIKRKNEEQIPEEELQGKYRKAYERLCGELKRERCEVRVWYVGHIRIFSEVLSGYLSQNIYNNRTQPISLLEGSAALLEALIEIWGIFLNYQDIRQEDEESWKKIANEINELEKKYGRDLLGATAAKVACDLDKISKEDNGEKRTCCCEAQEVTTNAKRL